MMWIRIEQLTGDDSRPVLVLPKEIAARLPQEAVLQHGLKKTRVQVLARCDAVSGVNTPEHPAVVYCSPSVQQAVMLIAALPYQWKVEGDVLELGPVVGLMLGRQRYYYHHDYMEEFTDSLSSYEDTGCLFIAFREEGILWGEGMLWDLYYHPVEKVWKYAKLPLPSVVFRRTFTMGQGTSQRLEELTQGKVFNNRRYDKYQIYQHLTGKGALKDHLPDTIRLTDMKGFMRFLSRHGRIILKPAGLSRGRGICIIHKTSRSRLQIYDYSRGESMCRQSIRLRGVEAFLREGGFLNQGYIIQPHLDLARINGNPFDIRVVMHRDERLQWSCSGIECRVAGARGMLTNISRGGQALPVGQALKLAFGEKVHPGKKKQEIIQIAETFCRTMDRKEWHFAEFGIDVAIDTEQRCWFIEANVRATFKGFKRMDYQSYLRICRRPILYAVALAGFSRRRRKHGSVQGNPRHSE